jgi:AcrR family transcriptional regulator
VQGNPIAQRIFQAAVHLFASKGYAGTSTREIVEGAAVTKPMLYYYFDSKEGLCRAMFAHFLEPFYESLGQLVASPLPAEELLIEVVAAHFAFCQTNMDFARLFYALYFGPDEQSAELELDRYTQRGTALVVEASQRACQAGLIRSGCEESFMMALQGMLNIWIMKALKDQTELKAGLAVSIVKDLLQGYRRR